MAEEKHLVIPKTARYFLHGTPSEKTKEIWFIIHGYGQLAQYFIRHFSHFDPETTLVAAPEGLSRFYLEGTSPDSLNLITQNTKQMFDIQARLAGGERTYLHKDDFTERVCEEIVRRLDCENQPLRAQELYRCIEDLKKGILL